MTNQTPSPQPSGLGAVLGIVQAVVAIVPRWLVVCAGLVFVAWLGTDLYFNARMKLAETRIKEAQESGLYANPERFGRAERAKAAEPTPVTPADALQQEITKFRIAEATFSVECKDGAGQACAAQKVKLVERCKKLDELAALAGDANKAAVPCAALTALHQEDVQFAIDEVDLNRACRAGDQASCNGHPANVAKHCKKLDELSAAAGVKNDTVGCDAVRAKP